MSNKKQQEGVLANASLLKKPTKKEMREAEKISAYFLKYNKLLLLKHFDYDLYATEELKKFPIELTIFWASMRDFVIKTGKGQFVPSWRTQHLELASKLENVEETENGDYTFTMKDYRLIIDKMEEGKIVESHYEWVDIVRTIKKEKYEQFKENFKDEIAQIKDKIYGIKQC